MLSCQHSNGVYLAVNQRSIFQTIDCKDDENQYACNYCRIIQFVYPQLPISCGKGPCANCIVSSTPCMFTASKQGHFFSCRTCALAGTSCSGIDYSDFANFGNFGVHTSVIYQSFNCTTCTINHGSCSRIPDRICCHCWQKCCQYCRSAVAPNTSVPRIWSRELSQQ